MTIMVGSLAMGRQAHMEQKIKNSPHALSYSHEAEKETRGMLLIFDTSKLPLRDTPPPTRVHLLTLSNSSSSQGPSIEICETLRAILIQATTATWCARACVHACVCRYP